MPDEFLFSRLGRPLDEAEQRLADAGIDCLADFIAVLDEVEDLRVRIESNDGSPWMACHYDWSEFVIFPTEIEALRYAVENSMRVVPVTFGASHGGALDG